MFGINSKVVLLAVFSDELLHFKLSPHFGIVVCERPLAEVQDSYAV